MDYEFTNLTQIYRIVNRATYKKIVIWIYQISSLLCAKHQIPNNEFNMKLVGSVDLIYRCIKID